MRKNRDITSKQLKAVDHHCPICDETMVDSLLRPGLVFLVCQDCNAVFDYYNLIEAGQDV
jgi:hypothetical protein